MACRQLGACIHCAAQHSRPGSSRTIQQERLPRSRRPAQVSRIPACALSLAETVPCPSRERAAPRSQSTDRRAAGRTPTSCPRWAATGSSSAARRRSCSPSMCVAEGGRERVAASHLAANIHARRLQAAARPEATVAAAPGRAAARLGRAMCRRAAFKNPRGGLCRVAG